MPRWRLRLQSTACLPARPAGGILLLTNIVALAVLSMPGRLQVFTRPPANTVVFGWPFIWLPTWLVLVALFGHLLVFRKWARERAHSARGT